VKTEDDKTIFDAAVHQSIAESDYPLAEKPREDVRRSNSGPCRGDAHRVPASTRPACDLGCNGTPEHRAEHRHAIVFRYDARIFIRYRFKKYVIDKVLKPGDAFTLNDSP
jgi:hypothetical protein